MSYDIGFKVKVEGVDCWVEHGIKELTEHPDKYRKYEAENGWGTVEGTLRFFQRILRDWEDFKASYPELVPVATFWIY